LKTPANVYIARYAALSAHSIGNFTRQLTDQQLALL